MGHPLYSGARHLPHRQRRGPCESLSDHTRRLFPIPALLKPRNPLQGFLIGCCNATGMENKKVINAHFKKPSAFLLLAYPKSYISIY